MIEQAIAYCGSAPSPAELPGRWNIDPVLIALLALVAGTIAWRMPAGTGTRRSGLLATALLAVLFVSPLCALTSALFSARVVHHLVLIAVVAPLYALAVPLGRRPALSAGPALALHAGTFWLWHVPALYAVALSSTVGYWTMQVSLLIPATLFWQAVLRGGGAAAMAALVAAVAQMGLLGAILTFASRPLYAPHYLTTFGWGLTPLEDQQLAGLLMWVPALLPYAIVGGWLARRFLMAGPAPSDAKPAPVA